MKKCYTNTRVANYIRRVFLEGFLKFQMLPNEFDINIFHTKESENIDD